MNRSISVLAVLAAIALAVTGVAVPVAPAQDTSAAQAGKEWRPATKVLFDNDKVRVQEVTFRPGDQGPNSARPFRVIRVLRGGTIQRVYPDGKVDNIVYKTGEVRVYEADNPFIPKNIGASDIVFYVVAVKSPKK